MTSGFAPIAGLAEIADRYGLILCDVFGTLQDAHRTFPEALDALRRFRRDGGAVVLVSNAADPGPQLAERLAARGIVDVSDALVSSADVARALIGEQDRQDIFHIGPQRDRILFEGLAVTLAGPEAKLLVCTGYPDDDSDLDATLESARRCGSLMLCTNPDTALSLGGATLRFAGLVANRYRTLGGTVLDTGKPGSLIYDRALAAAMAATGRTVAAEQVLAIGDTPALDAAGALARGFSAALIARDGFERSPMPEGGRRYRLPALVW